MGGRHQGTWFVDGQIREMQILSLPSPGWTPERDRKSGFSWKCYSPGQEAETRWQEEKWSLKLSSDCAYLKLEGVACLEWATMQS